MVAAHVRALTDCACHCPQILAVIFDAPAVSNRSSRVRALVISAAAFRDLNLRTAIFAGDAHNHFVHRVRPDFPSDVRLRSLWARRHFNRENPLLRGGNAFQNRGRGSHRAVIEIDADKIEGSANLIEISRLDSHDSLRQERKRTWVAAVQRSLEKPTVGNGMSALSSGPIFG